MKLCMIGTGYVGLVSGVCFSDLGNDVICVDKDLNKITKNFDPKSPSFGDWVINYLIYHNAGEDYLQEFYSTKVSGIISDKLRNKLLVLWESDMRKKVPFTTQVRQEIKDDRVLFIRIDEIFKERDLFLNKLTTFVQKEPNNELVDFYEQFKTAQKMYHMYQV